MSYKNEHALVSTDWLARHLTAPDVRIVDATSFLPGQGRNARDEYRERHIPGAVFFDIDEVADDTCGLPHMLPSPEKFSAKVRKMGLGDGNRVVVYDANGGFMAACRVWWMFRVFGHADVAVLDGGLPKWLAEGRPVEDMPPAPRERHFTARLDHTLVRSFEQMLENVKTGREQVADARAAARFRGEAPEPREGLRSGHIPGSVCLPVSALMADDSHFTMRPADELEKAISAAGIDPTKPLVATCGSGVTAGVIAFGLYLLGHDHVAVYDGSWTEWGGRDEAPVETGG